MWSSRPGGDVFTWEEFFYIRWKVLAIECEVCFRPVGNVYAWKEKCFEKLSPGYKVTPKASGTTHPAFFFPYVFWGGQARHVFFWKRSEGVARAEREYVNARQAHGCASCKYVARTPCLAMSGCVFVCCARGKWVVRAYNMLKTYGLRAISTLLYGDRTYTCCSRTVSVLTRTL